MALIKTDHQLEHVLFTFDQGGSLTDIQLQVNYAVRDDVTGQDETRVRKTVSVFTNLTPLQRVAANTLAIRLRQLALNV